MGKNSLVKTALAKMQERDYRNCEVSNVRIFNNDGKIDALADLRYTWMLNGWEKNVEKKSVVFVFINGEWHSPIFF